MKEESNVDDYNKSEIKNVRQPIFSEQDYKTRRMQQHMTENMIIEELTKGSGINGNVTVCVHKTSRIKYALKTLRKFEIKEKYYPVLRQEIKIMAPLDHPNIIRLHEYFETPEAIHLVLELCSGGELLDKLNTQPDNRFTEVVACQLVHSMLSAVRYCHNNNIVHRDLKLENFLFENRSSSSELKLIDFGLAHIYENQNLHTSVGTPYYVAPEVIRKNYNSKCDIWSIGVLAYMLLSGTPPFNGNNDIEILKAVEKGHFHFNFAAFNNISSFARDFIVKCLTLDVSHRPTAEQAQKHPWFQNLNNKSSAISLPNLQQLRQFPRKSKLCRIFMEVIAHTMNSRQIKELRVEFSKLDLDNSGEITLNELQTALQNQGVMNDTNIAELFADMDVERTGKIHYREFVAASLSMQDINEENMKLAFDKLSHHNDFVTAEDIRELLGRDATNEEVQEMMMRNNQPITSAISFDDFKAILYEEENKEEQHGLSDGGLRINTGGGGVSRFGGRSNSFYPAPLSQETKPVYLSSASFRIKNKTITDNATSSPRSGSRLPMIMEASNQANRLDRATSLFSPDKYPVSPTFRAATPATSTSRSSSRSSSSNSQRSVKAHRGSVAASSPLTNDATSTMTMTATTTTKSDYQSLSIEVTGRNVRDTQHQLQLQAVPPISSKTGKSSPLAPPSTIATGNVLTASPPKNEPSPLQSSRGPNHRSFRKLI